MNFPKLTPVLLSTLALVACGADQAELAAPGTDDLNYEVNNDALTTKGKFETFVGKDGKTYFHLLAGNGEKVLQSQGYATQGSAVAGIESLKANGQDASKYLLREASDGAWYFVVASAANGEILGISEMYVSQSNATRAMGSVATVVKQTVEQGLALTGDAKFEVFKGLDSRYYFHVRALNGEIVLQSQSYSSRTGAVNGAISVQNNGSDATKYTVLPAADGSFYFTLKAANGAIIARSETYASKAGAQRAVAGVLELLKTQLTR
ncbi:MAG: DUF1508 domain-containing protein [Archangiaceae bacterium]|nr:DUF1508 domain-containing protein [Archangiaceae bacterium]